MRFGAKLMGSSAGIRSVARGVLAATLVAFAGQASLAQDAPAPTVTQASAMTAADAGMAWSDSSFAPIADLLIGSWRTTAAAPSADGDSARVVMHIAATPIEGMSDTMYVEVAREDGLSSPYYQAIFQLYRAQNGVRLRTYEFRAPDGLNLAFAGAWALDTGAPAVGRSDLVARLDMDLRPEGAGYVGQTPYPYPTARGGAMEMTSRLELSRGQLRTRDQGLDAMGNVVWGSSDDTAYTFEAFDANISVAKWDDGLAYISYGGGVGDIQVADEHRVVFDYTGYLANGKSFDSSFKPGGRPLDYVMPGRLIQGWTRGVMGMTKGERRRLVIAPALGYGPGGNARAGIAGTDMLYFDVDLIAIEAPEPVAPSRPGPDNSGVKTIDRPAGVSGTGQVETQRDAPSRISPQKSEPNN